MLTRFTLPLLLLLLLTPAAAEPPALLTFARGSCYGTCPVYSLTVHADGRVEYEGHCFTDVIGRATSRLSPARLALLRQTLDKAELWRLSGEYTSEDATDDASAWIKYAANGRLTEIRHYHGDSSAPVLLVALEEQLDSILQTEKWVGSAAERSRASPSECPQHGEMAWAREAALSSLAGACESAVTPRRPPAEVSIALSKGSCQSAVCPIYDVWVHDNGKIDFHGDCFTKTLSDASAQLSKRSLIKLKTAFNRSSFWDGAEDLERTSDEAVVELSFHDGARSKVVRFGDRTGPRPLLQLAALVVRTTQADTWIGSREERVDRWHRAASYSPTCDAVATGHCDLALHGTVLPPQPREGTNFQPWDDDPSLSLLGDTILVLDRVSYSNRYASYHVEVYANGVVTFTGRHDSRVKGTVRRRLAPGDLDAISQAIQSHDFFGFDDNYLQPPARDRWQTTVRLSYGEGPRRKSIVHDFTCPRAPARLYSLEAALDRILGIERWTGTPAERTWPR